MQAGHTVTDRNAGPGARLRAERERLGVTVREVSETLNLTMGVVQAIEADDYGRLPGPVFTRGYLRAYARLLRIDPEPLLDGCPYAARDVSPEPERSEPALREWVRRRPALVLGSAGIVAAALLVAGLVMLWPEPGSQSDAEALQGSAPVARQNDVAAVAPAAGADLPLASAAAAQRDDLASTIDDQTENVEFAAPVAPESAPVGVIPPEPAAATDVVAALSGSAPATTPPSVAVASGSESGRRITAQGDDRLGLVFSDDCWVEVRDPEGRNLYSSLSRGGSTLTLIGQGPFRVLLGYAPSASLRFNGEPVPLEPHTRNNVASLVLGH